ncbi:MAG: SBBP repeat-containing protein [Chitinophagales bacterium]
MKRFIYLLCFFYQTAFSQHFQTEQFSSKINTGFVENKGQVMDQHHSPNSSVRYIYSAGQFNLQLKTDGFSYELFQATGNEASPSASLNSEAGLNKHADLPEENQQVSSQRIDVKFIGASSTELIPADASEALLNFYTTNTGTNGITNVRSYHSITYKNVYPGIDLVFSTPDQTNHFLKYEWRIHPGADASIIKMQYAGATALNPQADGSIDLLSSKGKINEGEIFAYTEEKKVKMDVQYVVTKNTVSYHIVEKTNNTLIIDPNITWFTYYGGSADEDLFEGELAIDKKGNPLLAGNTMSTSYIASTGAYQVTFGGGVVDGFAAKFKPNGKLTWATYYGSTSRDGCHAIAADALHNVFVGGNTYSSTGIATEGSHQSVFGGAMDAFLVKFDSYGIRQWATYFGGTGYGDQISAIECDASGNVYFDGYTCSPDNISTPGAYQEIYNGVDEVTGDVMVGAFTNSGTLLWCSYLSGPSQDRAHDLVLMTNGDFYIQGTCESTTQFASPGVHQSVYGGGPQDAFISKWNTTGHFYWCSYYGGEGDEHGRGLQIDAYGNAYMGGWTISQVGIATPGAVETEGNEGYNNNGDPTPDGYLAKFTPDGQLAWGTYYGGSDLDRSRGIAVDKANNFIYLVGQTGSEEGIDGNIFDADSGSVNQDGFIAKYTVDGALVWNYAAGGKGDQTVFDVEWDKNNSLYMVAVTDQAFFTTSDVYQSGSNGSDEVQLIKLNVADECFDKNEPNNTSATAKQISTTNDTYFFGYTGSVSASTDTDWFQFKTTSVTNLKLLLSDLKIDYDLYLYKKNGQLINSSTNPGATDESIIYNTAPAGQYLLKIVSATGSFDKKACYRLNAFTKNSPWFCKLEQEDIVSNQLNMQVSLFPNPASDFVTMKITSPEAVSLQAKIFTPGNQLVQSSEYMIEENTQLVSMDLRKLPPGIYILQLEANGKLLLAKLVIQQ